MLLNVMFTAHKQRKVKKMHEKNIFTQKLPRSPYLKPHKTQPKTCIICKKSFQAQNGRALTCSIECGKIHSSKRNIQARKMLNLGSKLGLKGGIIGKINENIVAIDLLKQGYGVYIAYEDTHPFDILAYKEGIYKRIEVKTGNYLPSGLKIVSGKHKLKEENYDILAIVTNLNEIEYRPKLV
jgi:predicted nucleic acid-binding Zn ribbon protein